jgi:hypothetical protein
MVVENNTKIFILGFLSIALIAASQLGVKSVRKPSDQDEGVVIKSSIESNGKNSIVIFKVENRKLYSICIDSNQFDSAFVRISLIQNGNEVPFRFIAEPPHSMNSQTNYAIPYFILMPNQVLHQYYNLSNFQLKKGQVKMKFLLPHYRCSDLSNESAYRRKREPEIYVASHVATLEIK